MLDSLISNSTFYGVLPQVHLPLPSTLVGIPGLCNPVPCSREAWYVPSLWRHNHNKRWFYIVSFTVRTGRHYLTKEMMFGTYRSIVNRASKYGHVTDLEESIFDALRDQIYSISE